MGNYVSCALNNNAAASSSTTQIVLPNSEIRHVSGGPHTSAADLMLDFPGHFLVDSRSLRVGSRFGALSADEELERGHVYVLFPMCKVNSVVKATDMGPLVLAARKAVRKASKGLTRVLPEMDDEVVAESMVGIRREQAVERVGLIDEEDESLVEFRNRMSLCRSRRPNLDEDAGSGIEHEWDFTDRLCGKVGPVFGKEGEVLRLRGTIPDLGETVDDLSEDSGSI